MSDVVFFSLVVLGFSIFYLIIKRKEGKEYKMNQQQIIQNYYIQQNISCYNYEKTINNENIFSNQLNKIFSFDCFSKNTCFDEKENSYFRDDYQTPKFKKFKSKV